MVRPGGEGGTVWLPNGCRCVVGEKRQSNNKKRVISLAGKKDDQKLQSRSDSPGCASLSLLQVCGFAGWAFTFRLNRNTATTMSTQEHNNKTTHSARANSSCQPCGDMQWYLVSSSSPVHSSLPHNNPAGSPLSFLPSFLPSPLFPFFFSSPHTLLLH